MNGQSKDLINKTVDFLKSSGRFSALEIRSATQKELLDLSEYYEKVLPETLKHFLSLAGYSPMWQVTTSSLLLPKVKWHRDSMIEDLIYCQSNLSVDPSSFKNTFAYFTNQNTYYEFFFLEDGDDPPAYRWGHGYKTPIKFGIPYSQRLLDLVTSFT